MNSLRPDPREIARGLELLIEPGSVCEVRIPKTRVGTIAGYFSDSQLLIKAVTELNETGPGTYCTINPVNKALLARASNRLKMRIDTTTTDKDILGRRWLPIDIDPQRASQISATAEEHQAALDRAREIRFTLSGEGWSQPILASSGNGSYLLYAIALPNDQASENLIKQVLRVLAQRFDDSAVRVDQSLFNASRIIKLFGSIAKKGDNVPDRPHRLSRIIDAPSIIQPVPQELLEKLAATLKEPDPPRPGPLTGRGRFSMDDFIARHHLPVRDPVPYEGGRKWVLEECIFNSAHKAPDSALFECADGSFGFKCFHNSCSAYGWRDVRALYAPPRTRAERSSWQPSDGDVPSEYRYPPSDSNGRGSEAEPPPNASQHIRQAGAPASEPAGALIIDRLADIEPRPISWLWRKRIPRGKFTLLAGLPGLGKSQATASIAAVVSTGGLWPVDRTRCERASVIFLTAEDDPEDTLIPRLIAAGADRTRLYRIRAVVAGYIGDGTQRKRGFSLEKDVDALDKKLAAITDVAVVIVDPVSAYLGDVDSHVNAEVRGALTPLVELAAERKVAIIGIDHLNKNVGAEAILRLPGSIAFVAAARASYLVTPDPADNTRQLFLPLKCNLAPKMPGLAYRFEGATVQSPEGPVETSRIMWDSEPVTMTADEALEAHTPKRTSALAEAEGWLKDALAGGPLPAKEVFAAAAAVGIKERTLRRAREALGVVVKKDPSAKGIWNWRLPTKSDRLIVVAGKDVQDGQGVQDFHGGNLDKLWSEPEAGQAEPEDVQETLHENLDTLAKLANLEEKVARGDSVSQ
jgi:hypothetical protein